MRAAPPADRPPPEALLLWPRGRAIHRAFRTAGEDGRPRSPIHFARSGPGAGNRFDAPDREYGVLYGAVSLRCALIEAVIRPGEGPDGTLVRVREIGALELAQREVAQLVAPRDLRLLHLAGAGLLAVGLDARISSSIDYAWTQRRALDLFRRYDVDGFAWRSRLDNDETALVLFEERLEAAPEIRDVVPLTEEARAILESLGCTVRDPEEPPEPDA
jgi:hypothetical protein